MQIRKPIAEKDRDVMKSENGINTIIIVSRKGCFIARQILSEAKEAEVCLHCFGRVTRHGMGKTDGMATQNPLASRRRLS